MCFIDFAEFVFRMFDFVSTLVESLLNVDRRTHRYPQTHTYVFSRLSEWEIIPVDPWLLCQRSEVYFLPSVIISFHLSIITISEHFFIFPFLLTWHTSSSFSTIPFFPSTLLLPLSCSPIWLFIISFHPLLSSLLLPFFAFSFPLYSLYLWVLTSNYSTFLPFASSLYISLSLLLILLFLPFTSILLLAIIHFSPVFLSKFCHLALPPSSYGASLWNTYVISSLCVFAVLSCQHMSKKQDINIQPSGPFVLKKSVTKEAPLIFAFIYSLGDGIGTEIHSVIVLTPQGIFKGCLQILVQYCVLFSLLWIALIWHHALKSSYNQINVAIARITRHVDSYCCSWLESVSTFLFHALLIWPICGSF